MLVDLVTVQSVHLESGHAHRLPTVPELLVVDTELQA